MKRILLRKLKTTQKGGYTRSTDIPLTIKKVNTNIFVSYLCGLFNDCINKCILPDILQHANNTLVFKKVFRASKENYRPLSTLPCV